MAIVCILATVAIAILGFFVFQILRRWQHFVVIVVAGSLLWILYIQSDGQNLWDYVPSTLERWNHANYD